MKTIQAIKLILEDCRQRIDRIVCLTKKDYDAQVKEAVDETLARLKNLYMLFPDLMPVSNTSNLTKEDIAVMIQTLEERVSKKYSARLLPTGNVLCDEICGHKIVTPAFSAWQGETAKEGNFVISYDKSTEKDAIAAMNYLVGNMLLSLPIKQVHLNFVNLTHSSAASPLMGKLDRSLFTYVSDNKALENLCDQMHDRMDEVLQNFSGDLVAYHEKNKKCLFPYEVIILLDYPNNSFDYSAKKLEALFENGHKGGVYFVVMHNADYNGTEMGLKGSFDLKNNATSVDLSAFAKAKPISLLDDEVLGKVFIEYLSAASQIEKKLEPIRPDLDKIFAEPYQEMDGDLEVPVGKDARGNVVNFILSDSDANHTHSFIIGTTRSGKSSFLGSFSIGAMMKYSPEDLQFYIMDFKGTEFSPYRNSKHVRTLITSGKDIHITVGVLRDIKREMDYRIKVFDDANCGVLTKYNKICPEKKLPRIILLADECQELFKTSLEYGKQYREMAELMSTIARKGSGFGIHLILATQTFANTDIPRDVMNNISDRFVLKCKSSSDSEFMIEGSSRSTASLSSGQVFNRCGEKDQLFQSYLVEREEVPGFIKLAAKKAGNLPAPSKQFCFDGDQKFVLTEKMIADLPSERYNVASLGCSIDVSLAPINIQLKKEDAENILFVGLDQDNVIRTMTNALVSLVLSAKKNKRDLKTYVINIVEDGIQPPVLDKLQKDGLIIIIDNNREASELILKLANEVIAENVEPTLLVVFNQHYMNRMLKRAVKQKTPAPAEDNGSGMVMYDTFNESNTTAIKTYGEALEKIIEGGPYIGLNTLLHVDRPKKMITADNVYFNYINARFNHVVVHQSDANASVELGIEDIKLDKLSAEPGSLRAVYCNYTKNQPQLFTPFVLK